MKPASKETPACHQTAHSLLQICTTSTTSPAKSCFGVGAMSGQLLNPNIVFDQTVLIDRDAQAVARILALTLEQGNTSLGTHI
jgi:hypothetical protein